MATRYKRKINNLIIKKLNIKLGVTDIPKLFKFSIAKVFEAITKPPAMPSSKHPLTVRVSKPKLLTKIKLSDSDFKQIIGASVVFSIFFAFSVGLTTSNFGALVRYKIPAVPFYLSAMLILYHRNKQKDIVEEEISD